MSPCYGRYVFLTRVLFGPSVADKTNKIMWLSFALVWGTMRIFVNCSDLYDSVYSFNGQPLLGSNPTKVNTWGFGQVVPVVLLL